jgi:hypothetical protein
MIGMLKTKERVEPPFGLMYLAAWLRKVRPDDRVEIWDAECGKLDYRKIMQFDVVGEDAKKKQYAKPVVDELRKMGKISPEKVKEILEVLNKLIGDDENKRFYNRPLIEALCLLGGIPVEELGQ